MRLALGLRRHGWEPSLAGPRESIIYEAVHGAGIQVARLPFERGYGAPGADARALLGLVARLRRTRFDLVHLHSAKAGVLGRIAARGTSTPTVYTPHCFPFVGPWSLPRRVFSIAVERALGPGTDRIVCVADAERRLALEHRIASSRRLEVIHNGTPPCDTTLERDAALDDFRGDGPLVACITVLRPQKAVHILLQAAGTVLDRVPEARIAIVGDGDLRPTLESRARTLGLDDRVRFFHFEAPASRQLRSIDLFVLPSAWEGFPISILEAMACGVPQVATDVGGTAEALVAGETGDLSPAGDPLALAERIVELLRDPERRGLMGEASRARHERLFGLERMVERTAAVYDGVVDRS